MAAPTCGRSGVVLYRALTGHLPHEDTTAIGEFIIVLCSELPPLVQSVAPWVPDEIARIVEDALQIDRDQRYESAEAMLAAMRAAPQRRAAARRGDRPRRRERAGRHALALAQRVDGGSSSTSRSTSRSGAPRAWERGRPRARGPIGPESRGDVERGGDVDDAAGALDASRRRRPQRRQRDAELDGEHPARAGEHAAAADVALRDRGRVGAPRRAGVGLSGAAGSSLRITPRVRPPRPARPPKGQPRPHRRARFARPTW